MTIARVNPGGWAASGEVTTAQINQFDSDHTNALDKKGDVIPAGASINLNGTIMPLVGGVTAVDGINYAGAIVAGGTGIITDNVTVGVQQYTTWRINATGLLVYGNPPTGPVCTTKLQSGSIATITGAGSTLKTASGGRLQLGDNDWIQFSATRTLTKLIGFAAGFVPYGTGWSSMGPDGVTAPGSPSSTPCTIPLLPQFLPPQGATLTRVDCFFTPKPVVGSAVPTTLQNVALFTRTIAAGSALPVRASSANASWSGAMSAYNTGQVLVMSITGLTLPVDVSTVEYSLRLTDAYGGSAAGSTIFHGYKLTYTATQLQGF